MKKQDRVLQFLPLPEDFGEIEQIPYEPPEPEPQPPTSLTPEAEENFLKILRASDEGKEAVREELRRQDQARTNSLELPPPHISFGGKDQTETSQREELKRQGQS